MPQQYFGEAYRESPAENYERYFVPGIGEPLAIDLVDVAAPGAGERVLDVACGTGIVARLAAARVGATGTVTGVDINPGMLAVARSVTPPGLSIDWRESSAEAMPFPDDAFDVVFCQVSFQFFPDQPAALREMRRVLAPGGRFVMNVPGPTPPIFAIMDDALARHVGEEAAQFVRMVFSLHDPGELQRLMSDAGFDSIAVRPETKVLRLPRPEEFLWQYVHSTPLAAAVARADEERRAALERDVVTKSQKLLTEGALVVEQGITVATARK